jgi:hypothetical protein
MICQHIRRKWGDAYLEDVRPALEQDWLRRLVLSPKYKRQIRSLMYRLFDKATLGELLNVKRNPMDLVEVKGISKRKRRPRVLQVQDAWPTMRTPNLKNPSSNDCSNTRRTESGGTK